MNFKKQMEFKGGKRHQLITDQVNNSNEIYISRYRGLLGVWYFIIDCVYHYENLLAAILILTIYYSENPDQLGIGFPIISMSVNILLTAIRNITFELRQRAVSKLINFKLVEVLLITLKIKRFVPVTWKEVTPGQIIRIRRNQAFPADCLLIDIIGATQLSN